MEQKQKELLDLIFPLVGGGANVTRHSFAGQTLYVTLKDRGTADLEALRALDGVTGVELTRGRLKIDLNETYILEEENKMAIDNKKIAQDVLEAVGGKGNVTSATHCMTRLRLNLKDATLAPEETVKNIPGVIGVVQSGGQFQIIIGQNVPKVYAEFCNLTGLESQAAINENLDGPKEKLTLKTIGSNILNYLSGSMTPMIPAMMGAGLCKALAAVLGPDMLHILDVSNNFYILLNLMFDGFYFYLPIVVGYNAAKKMNIPAPMGAYLGGILLAPGFLEMVNSGTPFDIFGINVTMVNYSQSVVPVLLSVAFMGLVYRSLSKVTPDAVASVVIPFCTVLISIPVALIALAPRGNIVANAIGGGIAAFGNATGFFGVAVIGAIWEFLVIAGMHLPVAVTFFVEFLQTGYQTGPILGAECATWAAFGVALGAFLRLKNKQEKSTAGGFFVSGIVGGITEPVLYGTCMKYRRCFASLAIGGFVGGAYMGITHVTRYVVSGSANILLLLGFAGGSTANLVNGIIGSLLSMVAAAVATYFIGFSKDELKG